MSDASLIIQNLSQANPIREPVLRSIIRSLQLPAGSQGLDAGCGIGLQAHLLAEAIGPRGHVTGVDILPELTAYGEELAARAHLSDRITLRAADVNDLPFDDDCFDWAWSADCIGYPAGDLMPPLQELMRVVRPGGEVVLLGWTSQQVLPGYPLLEARLNATCSGYIPFLQGRPPESHFMRALNVFRRAGLEQVRAQTFVGEAHPPLSSGERTALTSLFEMLWGSPQPEALREDLAEYRRLCTPGSADFILDIPDYYAFFTYSIFRGRLSVL
jgi:demethylmenaquinone methyltransferase/2-methoxy-6-polyprenyl-1,4-benzoquinol methylase